MRTIEHIIQDLATEADATILMRRRVASNTVHLYTARPGAVIGRYGSTIEKAREECRKRGYNIELHDCDEIFTPGVDWDDVIDKRAEAFWELEKQMAGDFDD